MSKVTKWSVDTAREAMKRTIYAKMKRWDMEHPRKGKDLPRSELAAIALSDPEWKGYVLAQVKRGYEEIDIRGSTFEVHSPMVAIAVKKNAAVDAARDKMRYELESELTGRMEEIIRSAIIGEMDGAELLKVVNEFCKR